MPNRTGIRIILRFARALLTERGESIRQSVYVSFLFPLQKSIGDYVVDVTSRNRYVLEEIDRHKFDSAAFKRDWQLLFPMLY